MPSRHGSAVVLAILFLVLLNAIGMYVVTAPVSVGESPRRHHQSLVARNMARSGAHAAIAMLPSVYPENSPYVRRIPSGPDTTGSYSVTSRRVAGEFELASEGSVPGSSAGKYRVRAVVRAGTLPGGRARIVRWEESVLPAPFPGAGR